MKTKIIFSIMSGMLAYFKPHLLGCARIPEHKKIVLCNFLCRRKTSESFFLHPKNKCLHIVFLIFGVMLLLVINLNLVSAHCPVCTAGALAGIGIAKTYGVDDSISGLLIGALIASSGLWVHNILKKRKINFPLQAFILIVIFFLSFAIPFYYKGVTINFEMVKSMPAEHSMLGMGIYGIDKLLFGMIFGTLLISGVFSFSDYLKEKNGKRLFAYQGFVFMIVALAIFSSIFWLITKNPVI